MLEIFDILPGFDASSALPELMDKLPEWRRAKALSYRTDIDRFLCAKSFLMLDGMLRNRFGINRCPEFSIAEGGKPFLREYPDVHFSISHCRKGIACAVSDSPVGVDIEEIQFDAALAPVVLNADELAAVTAAEGPALAFTWLWTRKESYLKLTGEGIVNNLRDVLASARNISFRTESNPAAGYVVTLAEK